MYENMKRVRSCRGPTGEESLEQKRKREKFYNDNDEMQLRDKLLDEISSSQSSLEYDNNVSTFEHSRSNETQPIQDRKIIKLEGSLPNLALPDGWIALNHRSGGIVYLHRSTRVCTWSRPYSIGKGSVRKHDVPIAAIPCLHQSKALSKKSSKAQKLSSDPQQAVNNCHSAQDGSILHFLNAAGSQENESQTIIDHCVADKLLHCREMSNIKGINRSESNLLGFATGTKKEIYTSTQDEIRSVSASTIVREGGNDSIDKIKTVKGDSVEVNQVHKTIDNCDFSVKCCEKGDDGNSMENDVSYVIIGENNRKCENNDAQKDNGEVFHPKNGLDVIIEALNKETKEYSKEDEDRSSSNIYPICTSKLNISLSPNTSLKIMENNKLNQKQRKKNATSMQEEDYAGTNPSGIEVNIMKYAELQTASNNDVKQNENLPKTTHWTAGIELIDAQELSIYLGRLFEFEELTVDQEQNVVKPTEPVSEARDSALSMLECLPYCVKGKNARDNKEWVLNPGGKTPVAILHEYSQAVLREKPVYLSSECENASTPFMAEVQINGITHGSGVASTKRQAKQMAAEATLDVLLPDVFRKIRDYVVSMEELECFDKLEIDNPSIYELSIKSGLPTPSQILEECLKRNQGICSSTVHFKLIPGQNQDHRFVISCGKHTAEGPCKNKKTGKQFAAQALLMKLHPHISTWGCLLRIYCNKPSSIVRKYKTPDKDSLSNCISTPDISRGALLLTKLKEKMLKIADNSAAKRIVYTTNSKDS